MGQAPVRAQRDGEVTDQALFSAASTSGPVTLWREIVWPEIGGFDPRLVGLGGGGCEIAVRPLAAGVRIAYERPDRDGMALMTPALPGKRARAGSARSSSRPRSATPSTRRTRS